MTVNEFMEEKSKPNVMYHFGAASAFLFVLTKDEYFSEIDNLTNTHLETMKSRLADYKRFIKANPTSIMTISYREREKLLEEQIEKFTDFRTREVLDVYKRIGDGVVIKFDGDESGRFWCRDEYLNKRRGR